jgi:hypothetical protein
MSFQLEFFAIYKLLETKIHFEAKYLQIAAVIGLSLVLSILVSISLNFI